MVSPKNDHKEVSMETIYYIGLDIYKKVIACCIKTKEGTFVDQGTIGADRAALSEWVNGLPGPWIGAMREKEGIIGDGEKGTDLLFFRNRYRGICFRFSCKIYAEAVKDSG
jgi:hypothetical protein